MLKGSEKEVMLEGVIKDLTTGKPLEDAKVTIYNIDNVEITETFSCKKGTFNINVIKSRCPIKLIVFKKGYRYAYNLIVQADNIKFKGLEINLIAPCQKIL